MGLCLKEEARKGGRVRDGSLLENRWATTHKKKLVREETHGEDAGKPNIKSAAVPK
jgi:hypothetical protein